MRRTVFHSDPKVLEVKFDETIGLVDLLEAFALYEDERFTDAHDVLFDGLGSTFEFGHDAFGQVQATFGQRNLRGVGTRTAIVLDSMLQKIIVGDARDVRANWGTNWRFFTTRDDAWAWLSGQDSSPPDFAQTIAAGAHPD